MRARRWSRRSASAGRCTTSASSPSARRSCASAGRSTRTSSIEIRKHPVTGAKMLGGIRSLRVGVDCVLHHHERWDGDGYPYGLAGATIPLEARIVSVADAFDAMISDRPYRAAMPREAALAEVDRCSGSQFDPQGRERAPHARPLTRFYRVDQTSSFVRVRRITSSVNSDVAGVPAEVGRLDALRDRLERRLADRAAGAPGVFAVGLREQGGSREDHRERDSRRSCPAATVRCRARPRPSVPSAPDRRPRTRPAATPSPRSTRTAAARGR